MSARCVTATQRTFASNVAGGLTIRAAGELAGVCERTARRWMRSPAVLAEVHEYQDAYLGEVTRRLESGGAEMLDVLSDVAADAKSPPAVRLRAAQVWLETMLRARETLTLSERVAALEAAMTAKEARRGDGKSR